MSHRGCFLREETLGGGSSAREMLGAGRTEREEVREEEGRGLREVRVPPSEGQGCGSSSGSRGASGRNDMGHMGCELVGRGAWTEG